MWYRKSLNTKCRLHHMTKSLILKKSTFPNQQEVMFLKIKIRYLYVCDENGDHIIPFLNYNLQLNEWIFVCTSLRTS